MASKRKKATAPWKRSAPKSAHHTSLTPAQKKHAAARAKKAGRSYPNLVDNMHEATESGGARKKSTGRKAAAKKKTGARKTSASKTSGTRKTSARKTSARKASNTRKTSTRKTATRKASGARKTGTRKKSTTRKASTKRAPAKRRRAAPRVAQTKDPKGGLTAAGRRAFKERDGSQLKPGVMKSEREMTPEEMRRKGSWASRFYGRAKLPALTDRDGKPTRFALSAHAWGEPVPKTEAAARRIAEKGRRLLARAAKARG